MGIEIENWWNRHHRAGGLVWQVDYPIDHYRKDWLSLQDKAGTLDPQDWRAFRKANITDNSMKNRVIMEDYSKVAWLREQFTINGLTHPVTLLYERWRNRWRVHPGSGRCIAAASLDWPTIPAVYIDFHWARPRKDWGAKTIDTVEDFKYYVNSKQFDVYLAYSEYAVERDAEWDLEKLKSIWQTNDYWHLVRWSEGSTFLRDKKQWREYGTNKYI
tara:strand:- start:2548 stop:3195 length:648 start_codon:yes stop_codon:yes gene_type:complete